MSEALTELEKMKDEFSAITALILLAICHGMNRGVEGQGHGEPMRERERKSQRGC